MHCYNDIYMMLYLQYGALWTWIWCWWNVDFVLKPTLKIYARTMGINNDFFSIKIISLEKAQSPEEHIWGWGRFNSGLWSLKVCLIFIFSYASTSSSTLYPCQWVSQSVDKSSFEACKFFLFTWLHRQCCIGNISLKTWLVVVWKRHSGKSGLQ